MVVFALRVLLDPVSISEICEADRAANQARVDHLLSESDHPHLLEHSLIDPLLKQIDTKLSQRADCGLVSGYIFLDVEQSILIDFLVGFVHLAAVQLP